MDIEQWKSKFRVEFLGITVQSSLDLNDNLSIYSEELVRHMNICRTSRCHPNEHPNTPDVTHHIPAAVDFFLICWAQATKGHISEEDQAMVIETVKSKPASLLEHLPC